MKKITLYKEVVPGYFNTEGEVPAPKGIITDFGKVTPTAVYKKISGRTTYDLDVPTRLEASKPLNHIEIRDGKVFSVSYVQSGMVRENIISQYLGNGQWSIPKQY